MKVRLALTLRTCFYYRLSHIIKTEITVIVLGPSFQVDGTLTEKNRNEFDVVADILRVAILGSKESEIMVKCGLDRELLEKYMITAVVLKLVSVERRSENFYRLTDRGLEFLRFYHGLRWLLWGQNLDSLFISLLSRLKTHRKPYYIR